MKKRADLVFDRITRFEAPKNINIGVLRFQLKVQRGLAYSPIDQQSIKSDAYGHVDPCRSFKKWVPEPLLMTRQIFLLFSAMLCIML